MQSLSLINLYPWEALKEKSILNFSVFFFSQLHGQVWLRGRSGIKEHQNKTVQNQRWIKRFIFFLW